jgi:UDP-glucose 4-epimerase
MQKTILVTGGAGFIGSHLCERLSSLGHKVISLDNYLFGVEENHVAGVLYKKGHTKDIEDHVLEAVDIVYHLGEYPRVEQSFADIELVLDSNVIGTKAVVEFARKRKCKLVYAGSSTKFADGGIGRDQSPYAWTKASNTELVRNYGEWFGLEYAITYFYNVYGPRERGERSSGTVVAIFAKQSKENKTVTVYAPGTQRRNFTHVDDIVDGLIRVGEHGQGDEYGLGHPDSYSILEVAEMFNTRIVMGEEQKGNRMQSRVDVNRASLELGWKPKYNLPEYIAALTREL